MTHRFFSFSARTALLLAGGLALWSCDPDDNNDASPAGSNVFIVQEGSFTRSNAEIVGFNSDAGAIINAALFRSVNNRLLGDVAQSMTVVDNLGYIVVNNSRKIEVVSLPDFSQRATISTFTNANGQADTLRLPRYFANSNNKGYVSQRVNYSVPNGRVSVINLTTNQITKTIQVGSQPEQMAVVGNKLFVSNNGSNTISVINTQTDVVEATITVGDSPASMVVDRNNALWVMCSGQSTYPPPTYAPVVTVPGSLVRIDPATNAVTTTLRFATGQQASNLRTNGAKDQLIFLRQTGVYRMSITDAALPTTPLLQRRGGFYGLGVDPRTGVIYGSPQNFSGTARFFRYQTTGQVIDSFTIGTSANSFVFYN